MKIIIPVLGFGKAGGYRVLSRIASEWIAKGHDVIFVCPRDYHDIYYPTTAKVCYVASIYQILPKFLKNKLARDFFGLLSLLYFLIFNSKKGDVVLANRDLTAYAVWLAGKITSAFGFYYIQAYEPDFYSWSNKSATKIARYISAKTYGLPLIRIVNANLYCQYEEIASDMVIPPGYDESIFYPKEALDFSGETVTIGCIGRKQAWKGTAELVQAVLLAAQQDSRIRLKIAFEIPIDLELPGFAERVYPHGDNNLAEFYRSCDIFITSGKIQHGAFHYPCLEALACGVPLIASPYYPADTSNSIILDDTSPEAICHAILKMLNLKQVERMKMKSNGIAVAATLKWGECSNKFIEMFERCKND